MFKRTERAKDRIGNARFFGFCRSFFSERSWRPPVSDDVKATINQMANRLQKELYAVERQYDELVHAVEYTIFERVLDLVYKTKAIEFIIAENEVPGNTLINMSNNQMLKAKVICMGVINDVGKFALDLPYNYTEIVRELLSDPDIPHWSKICRYMPINKPHNFLDDLFARLTSAPLYFRELVQDACGWTIDVFFARKANRVLLKKRRVLDHPFTEAEAHKIIAIFREIVVPDLLDRCSMWESMMKEQKKTRI